MASSSAFRALTTIDYVDAKGSARRATPGDEVEGLAKETAAWLVEAGAIEATRESVKAEEVEADGAE